MKITKMVKVLEEEKGLCDHVLQNGARCVVGALLYRTGEFTKRQLRDMDGALTVPMKYGPYGQPDESSPEAKARRVLKKEYDIEDGDIQELIDLNDSIPVADAAILPTIDWFAADRARTIKDERKRKAIEERARLELILTEMKEWRKAGVR